MSTYRSPLLDRAGAVAAEGADAGVALHYGDPMREQRALAEEAGWVDRSHREVLTVGGDDRLEWLHTLTSQHVSELTDGVGTEALVLSAHGHVEHHLQLAEVAGSTWIDVEPGTAEPLLAYLDSMRFWSKVEPVAADDVAVLSVVGPATETVLEAAGMPVAQGVRAVDEGGWVRRMAWPGEDAADLLVPRAQLTEIAERLDAAGARPAGSWAFEALRVESRRPRLGFETDHRTIPHEVGWIGVAVHLDKGCYRGQETVARVHNLGKPPRRLVLLHLDGSQESVPEQGTPISYDGRAIGFVGTAVRHHELGTIALGLVKRNVPDDAALLAGDVPAAIDT